MFGIALRDHGAARADSRHGAHDARRFHDGARAPARRSPAIIASGIVPAALEMMDQACVQAVEASIYAAGYPTDAAAVLLVELDGGAEAVAAETAWSTAAPRRTARATCRPPPRRRSARGSGRAGRRRSAPWAASRRIWRCRTPSCPARVLPDVLDRIRQIRDRVPADHQQRLPCRRRESASEHQLRPATTATGRPGARRQPRDHGGVRRGRGQHHRRARRRHRQDRLHALHLRCRHARRHVRRAPGVRSRRAGQSRQGRSAPCLPRVAGRPGGCHERRRRLRPAPRRCSAAAAWRRDPSGRAAGHARDAPRRSRGLPLAHEEGWKMRIEGRAAPGSARRARPIWR